MLRVVTSSQSAARDGSAIAAGIPSRALMQRAGAAAASEIALRLYDRLDEGVLVLAGPGNNGGDAWVVARALHAAGVDVRVLEPVHATTDDARAERALALEILDASSVTTGQIPSDIGLGCGIIVDGLLGTGGRASLDGIFAGAMGHVGAVTASGAVNVALDIVSGIDASTGEADPACVAADLTLAFATIKRGHLVNRDLSGTIAVLDIGLGRHVDVNDGAASLVDSAWAAAHVPRMQASTHKGDRKKLVVIGGHEGMAGATLLAARGAFRSGIGMVKLVVAPASVAVIQEAEPQALAARWPEDDASAKRDIVDWADAVVIGPGLGRDATSRAVLERVLRCWTGPTLLDADALTLFEGRRDEFARLLAGRAALITPHVVEFSRVSGVPKEQVEARRFEIGADLARTLNAAVLLKGVPTVITAPDGRSLVSATGTPALGTGGSGDVLSGVSGTLLAQTGDPLVAGALGAFAHGRAAECVAAKTTRGITLDDIVDELRDVWDFQAVPRRSPVLHELPAID